MEEENLRTGLLSRRKLHPAEWSVKENFLKLIVEKFEQIHFL